MTLEAAVGGMGGGATEPAATPAIAGRSLGQIAWLRLRRDRVAMTGGVVIVVLILLAVASVFLNAAGVIQYCVKNNYLNAASANGVKDKLLGMVTGQKPQQTGYANGAKGLLMGSDGQSLNLKGLSGKLKEKACDYVLKNASSLF